MFQKVIRITHTNTVCLYSSTQTICIYIQYQGDALITQKGTLEKSNLQSNIDYLSVIVRMDGILNSWAVFAKPDR